MVTVSLSSPTFDIDGYISFEIKPGESELENLERRVNRSQNLDGTVTILDNGFVQGDRTITIGADLTQDQFNKIKYLFRKYSELVLSAQDGVYKVTVQKLNNRFGAVTMTLLVSEALTDYRPYTTTTTTSTSSSTTSQSTSCSSSCSTQSTQSTQSTSSSSSSTASTQSSSSSSSSTVTCDYNEFFQDLEKWWLEFQNNVNYSAVSDTVQFQATVSGGGGCQLIYKWQIANGDFDIRIDIPLHDGGVIQGFLTLVDEGLTNTDRVFIKYWEDAGTWKVFARARVNGVNQPTTEIASTCDKIRIVRNGTVLLNYYHKDGQWHFIRSDDFGAYANNLKAIRLRSDSSGTGTDRVRFDNLVFWGGCPDGTHQWTSSSSTQSTTSTSSSSSSSCSSSCSTQSTTSSSTHTSSSSSSSSSTTTTSPP